MPNGYQIDILLLNELSNRVESFFSEMAILWGLLRYTTKGQKFWPYGLFKAARPKRPKKFLKPSMAQNA